MGELSVPVIPLLVALGLHEKLAVPTMPLLLV